MSKQNITYGIGFKVDKTGLEDLKKELKEIGKKADLQLKLLDSSSNASELKNTQDQLTEIKKISEQIGIALNASFNAKLNSISLQDFEKKLKDLNQKTLPDISKAFRGMGEEGSKAFFDLTSQLLTTKRELKETHSLTQKMAETLSNTIRWNIASAAINAFTGSISEAWNYAQRLDSSLNDIRIVTGKSADEMERFAKQANTAAKSLGAQTTNYTNAALIYYQQGLDEKQVQARAEATVKAANVTGQSASEVSEQLTSLWNGYKVASQDTELYVDKLAAVAAETAADLEELSVGMSKVSSAASTMGIDVDQLTAQLATIISVTRQDASVVGTALKTIYSRMGDLEVDGVDEFGVTLGDVSSQLRQMGIDVLDEQGNLRDMGIVVEEVAAKWGTWTKAQQQAAAVAIAGKRQYNNLFALFENWDMYESALSTSKNSTGTLQKQQEIYMESLEAHLNKLATSAQRAYDALVNTDSMNSLIDLLSGAVDLAATFAESIGGAGNLLMGIMPYLSKFVGKELGSSIATGVTNFKNNLSNQRENAAQERTLKLLQDINFDAPKAQAEKRIAERKKETESEKAKAKEKKDAEDQRYRETIGAANDNKKKEIETRKAALEQEKQDKLSSLDSRKKSLNEIDKKLSEANKVIYSEKFVRGGKTDKSVTPQGKTALEATSAEKTNIENYLGKAVDADNGPALRKIAQAEMAKIDTQKSEAIESFEKKRKECEEEIAKIEAEQNTYFEGKQREYAEELSKIEAKQASYEAEQARLNEVYSQDAQTIIDLKERQIKLSSVMSTEELNASDERIAAIAAEIKAIREKESALASISDSYKLHAEAIKFDTERAVNPIFNEITSLKKVRENLETANASGDSDTFKKNKKTVGAYGVKTKGKSPEEVAAAVDQRIKELEEQAASFQEKIGRAQEILEQDFTSGYEGYEKLLTSQKEKTDKLAEKFKEGDSLASEAGIQITAQGNAEDAAAVANKGKNKRKQGTAKKNLDKELDKSAEQAKKLDKYVASIDSNLKNSTYLTFEQSEELDKLVESYKAEGATLTEKKAKLKEILDFLKASKEAAAGEARATEDIINARKQEELIMQKLLEEQQLKDGEKQIQKVVTNITQVAGAIGGVVSAVNIARNLFTTWTDDSLSAGEKISQTITGIISILTILFPIISSIGPEILKSTSIGKMGLKIMGDEGAKAGIKIALSFAYIIVPLLAITAALVGIVALFSYFANKETALDKAKKEFEELSERADAAKNKVNELKESYSNLMEEISQYRDTKAAIDEMRVGTEEWQEATEALNNQVEELIEKYPELADAVQADEYGNLFLDEGDISKAAAAQRQKIKEQKTIAAGLAVRASEAEADMIVKQAESSIVNNAVTGGGGKLDESSYKKFLEKFGLSSQQYDFSNEGIKKLVSEVNLDELRKSIDDSLGSDWYKKNLNATIDSLESARKSLEENSEKTVELTKAYLKDEGENFGIDGEIYTNLVNGLKDYKAAEIHTYEDFFKDENIRTWNEEENKWQTVHWVGKTFNTSKDKSQAVETLQNMAAALETSFDVSQIDWKNISTFDDLKNVVLSNGMTVGEMVNAYGAKQARDKDAENNDAIIKEQKQLLGRLQEAAYFNKNLVGDNAIEWNGATLNKLSAISGYGAEYKELANAAAASLTKTIQDTFSGTGVDTKDVSKFGNLTADQVNALKNNINAASFSGAGDLITNAINNITDPTKIEEFQALLSKVDWSSATSINEFRAGLAEAGIEIEDDQGSWDKFIKSVNSGMKQWVENAKKVQEALAFIRDTVEDIQMGDLISDEEYKEMIAINPAIAKYFVKTAGGMVAIANGKEIAGKMKDQYEDLADIQKHYKNIEIAVGGAKGNANLKKEDVTDKDSILSYIGEGGSQQNFKATAQALGLAGSGNLNDIIAKAGEGDAAALETLSSMIMQVNQARLDVENGEYDAAAAQAVYGTTVANSWSEARENIGAWANRETRDKVEAYWKTNYLQTLGLDTLDFDAVKALGINELQAAAENAKKLELDYLKQIDHEINKLSLDIDKAFGSKKAEKLIEQIANQQERAGLAAEEYKTAKSQYDIGIKAAQSAGLNVFTDGELDYKKLIKNHGGLSESDPNYQLVQTLISNMETLNDKELEREEAEQAIIDAQVEAFNSIYDTIKLAKTAAIEWKKNLQSLSQTKKGGITAFGEKSVTDSISEAIDLAKTTVGFSSTGGAYGSNADIDYSKITDIQNNKDKLFGDDDASYQENLDKALNDYYDTLSSMQAAGEELYQLWSSGLERISQLYEEQVAKISTINSILQSSIGLNTILGNGVTAAYTKIRQNAADTVNLYQEQVESLKVEYDKFFDENGKLIEGVDESKATEAWDAYATAQQNFVNALQEQYQAIQDEFAASLNDIIKTAFGGVSFDNVSELWNLEKSKDDIYFDETNANYERYKLERTMQKSIDATDDIVAQNKLKKVMEDQLDILKQKEKISQADIDNANAVYDLTLKQIALEEAQNTADKMKLTRDASGNYTYQYVADQDKIAQAEEDLAAAENNLYNLQKKHQEDLIDTLLSGVQQYQELLIKYMNDPEMTEKINEYYKEYFDNLGEDFEGLNIDLDKITTAFGNGATFDSITSAVGGVSDLLNGEEGFTAMINSFKASVETMNSETTGISAVVNRLGGYVEGADTIKEQAADISTQMQAAKEAMEGLSASLSSHVDKLTNLVGDENQGYIKYLADNTGNLRTLNEKLGNMLDNGIQVYGLVTGAAESSSGDGSGTAINAAGMIINNTYSTLLKTF